MQLLLCLRIPTLAVGYLCRISRHFGHKSNEVKSVLVVRLDGMGDCVLTLPLLSHLRLCLPSAAITVVARPTTEAVFRASRDIDEVLTFEPFPGKQTAKLFHTLIAATRFYHQHLRGRSFDIALTPRWDIDVCMATFLCFLTRAQTIVGYEDATTMEKSRGNRGFERAFSVVLPAGFVRHEVDRNLELAVAIGCSHPSTGPRMMVDDVSVSEARKWLPPREVGLRIALGLPAGSPKRRWSAQRYLEVLEALRQLTSLAPIILTDDETADAGKEILGKFSGGRIASSLTLPQISGILAECDLFLGSDSGLAHVAASVGCPTIVVSPHPSNGDPNHTNSPHRFRPYGEHSFVFQPIIGRVGCEQGCEAEAPHCILDIDPQEISRAITQLCRLPEAPSK